MLVCFLNRAPTWLFLSRTCTLQSGGLHCCQRWLLSLIFNLQIGDLQPTCWWLLLQDNESELNTLQYQRGIFSTVSVSWHISLPNTNSLSVVAADSRNLTSQTAPSNPVEVTHHFLTVHHKASAALFSSSCPRSLTSLATHMLGSLIIAAPVAPTQLNQYERREREQNTSSARKRDTKREL